MPTARRVTSRRRNVNFRWANTRTSRHEKPPRYTLPEYSRHTIDTEVTSMNMPFDQESSDDWSMWTSHPQIQDFWATETSATQDETVELVLQCFDEEGTLPSLDVKSHVQFLHRCLQKMPGQMVGLDASRPWQLYWTLAGLSVLGEDISHYRSRYEGYRNFFKVHINNQDL